MSSDEVAMFSSLSIETDQQQQQQVQSHHHNMEQAQKEREEQKEEQNEGEEKEEQKEEQKEAEEGCEALSASVKRIRSFIQASDSSLQGVDNVVIERFFITNNMDEKKASDSLLKYLKWRSEYTPLGYVAEEEIVNERKKGKLCLQGHDKVGRTLGVFLIARHDAYDRDLEEFKRYTVYAFDKAVASTKHKLQQLSVIVDLAGWSYRSFDVSGYLSLLNILQDYYFNHLGKIILIHVPFLFWAAWKVTSPFFNDFTRERMIFVEDKDLKSVLLDEIDEDQLPEIYGGKLPLEPV